MAASTPAYPTPAINPFPPPRPADASAPPATATRPRSLASAPPLTPAPVAGPAPPPPPAPPAKPALAFVGPGAFPPFPPPASVLRPGPPINVGQPPAIHQPLPVLPTTLLPGWVANPDQITLETQLRSLYFNYRPAFELLVGLYFQDQGRHPALVGDQWHSVLLRRQWMRDLRKIDYAETCPAGTLDQWVLPLDDALFLGIVSQCYGIGVWALERVIRWWASLTQHEEDVRRVLMKAGWIEEATIRLTNDWKVMDSIFKMAEGEEKVRMTEQARAESRWFEYRLNDYFCGM